MTQHAPGSYFGRPIRAVTTELGENRSPALVITFDVTHRADSMVEGGWAPLPQPEQRDVKLFLTDNAWPYTEAKLKTFGFNGNFGSPEFSAEFKEGTELVCTSRAHNGKSYEQWDFPAGGSAAEPASTDAVRQLNAKWKTNNVVAAAKPAGAPPAAPVRRTVHAPAATKPTAPTAAAPTVAGNDDPDGPPF